MPTIEGSTDPLGKGRDLYITSTGASPLFHIHDAANGDRSLCGRYGVFFRRNESCDPVKGNEAWRQGEDCKPCFRKAGLKVA